MMVEILTELAAYLQEKGYAADVTQVQRGLELLSFGNTDVTDPEEVCGVLRPVFSQNPAQYLAFPEHFHTFAVSREKIRRNAADRRNLEEAGRQRREEESRYAARRGSLEEQLEEMRQRFEKKRQALEQEFWSQNPDLLTRADHRLLEKMRETIEREPVLTGVFFGERADLAEEAMAILRDRAQDALLFGDREAFRNWQGLYRIAQKRRDADVVRKEQLDRFVTERMPEERKAMRALEDRILAEKRDHEETQKNIDREMEQLMSRLQIKKESEQHREVFEGGGAVVLLPGTVGLLPPGMDLAFEDLSSSQRRQIADFIRDNVLRFRTRLTRNLQTLREGALDLRETIRAACRTGGVPLSLIRRKKRPGRADLVLILDVSGSCQSASAMMLTFFYYLQQAFPNGCRAFAFVNSLYDISPVLGAGEIEKALPKVLSMIPRRGVYSDYSRPLHSLWTEHRQIFRKDTIVIFAGDARNNRNPSFSEDLKNICRRVRYAYWLNTEEEAMWGQGDSAAKACMQILPMREVVNSRQLIGFLADGLGKERR